MIQATSIKYHFGWFTGFSTLVIAMLVAFASTVGLFVVGPYVYETENWRLQAQGQDTGNLLAVIVLIASFWLARKGSFKAYFVWLGTLFYILYAYIIYAVAVHFNPLFLIYVAVLGLATYTLLFNLEKARRLFNASTVKNIKLASYTLLGTGLLFGVLWLGEIIPALIAGDTPKSTLEAGLWVNPVYVIDLSTVIPGFIITGILALRRSSSGLFFVAPWLAFSVLMGSSIVAAMILMQSNGFANTIPPMIMVGVVVLFSLAALFRFLKPIDQNQ